MIGIYQGHKSNTVAHVPTIEAAIDWVKATRPGWDVFLGMDGDVITASCASGGAHYGIRRFTGVQGS